GPGLVRRHVLHRAPVRADQARAVASRDRAIRPLAFTTKRAVASYRAIATTMLAAYPFATAFGNRRHLQRRTRRHRRERRTDARRVSEVKPRQIGLRSPTGRDMLPPADHAGR